MSQVPSDRVLQILFEVTMGRTTSHFDTPEERQVRRELVAEVKYAKKKGWIIETPSSDI